MKPEPIEPKPEGDWDMEMEMAAPSMVGGLAFSLLPSVPLRQPFSNSSATRTHLPSTLLLMLFSDPLTGGRSPTSSDSGVVLPSPLSLPASRSSPCSASPTTSTPPSG